MYCILYCLSMITSANILKWKPWNLETLLQECQRLLWSVQRENLSLAIKYKSSACRSPIKLILFPQTAPCLINKFKGQMDWGEIIELLLENKSKKLKALLGCFKFSKCMCVLRVTFPHCVFTSGKKNPNCWGPFIFLIVCKDQDAFFSLKNKY